MAEQPLIGWDAIESFLMPLTNLGRSAISIRRKHMLECKAVVRIRRGIGKRGSSHRMGVFSFPSMIIKYLSIYGEKF